MDKALAFEDILKSEFRWPTEGDVAFVKSIQPVDNAIIEEDEFARLVFMLEGYKRIADLAVVHSAVHKSDRDFLIYPIIFNYRHFLELSLKYQLATHGPTVGEVSNWKSHNLEKLWDFFQNMLDCYGALHPDEARPVVKQVILEFAKIDPKSDTYRYPVDQNGHPLPISFADVDLENLSDVMNAVAGYFNGCDGHLSSMH
jgi:hypothetical protein